MNTPVNAGHAQATAMVDELIRCGMTHACLSPGSRSTPMALALAARPELALHVSIDERSMSFLALGIAKAGRRPVALLTTSGTATAHLYPAVIEASHSQVPLVVLTADRPPELRDTGAGQTIDQIKLYSGAVRWFCETGVPEARAESVPYWRSVACRAYQESLWPVPGPVHLNLAYRNPLVPTPDAAGFAFDLEGRPQGKPWTQVSHSPMPADPRDLERLRAELESTERGVIAVGTYDGDPAPIVALAGSLGWPLLAEATSNCRQGPHAISTYDALVRQEGFWQAHRPELVLRIGNLGTSSKLTARLDASVRQIALGTGAWLDPTRAISWMVRADPGLVCAAVAAGGPQTGGPQTAGPQTAGLQTGGPQTGGPQTGGPQTGWLQSWRTAEAAAAGAIDAYLQGTGVLTEPAVARELAAALPAGATLMVASSMPVRDLDWFMRPRSGVRILSNRGANGIDGFVSCCLGAAISNSGSSTVGLCGDLSLLHDQNGLLPAADPAPDAVLVVVNNNGGGIFSFLPQAAEPEFERLFGTAHHLDLSLVAQSHGCAHRQIRSTADLAPALAGAVAGGGIHILEAKTDRQLNVEVHNRIWAMVDQAVG